MLDDLRDGFGTILLVDVSEEKMLKLVETSSNSRWIRYSLLQVEQPADPHGIMNVFEPQSDCNDCFLRVLLRWGIRRTTDPGFLGSTTVVPSNQFSIDECRDGKTDADVATIGTRNVAGGAERSVKAAATLWVSSTCGPGAKASSCHDTAAEATFGEKSDLHDAG
jgi:hypothetical protein